MGVIDFKSKQCKISQHSFCHGSWIGLGFQFICGCACHQKKKSAIDRILEPPSIADNTCTPGGL